jgi:hypothetical protein
MLKNIFKNAMQQKFDSGLYCYKNEYEVYIPKNKTKSTLFMCKIPLDTTTMLYWIYNDMMRS